MNEKVKVSICLSDYGYDPFKQGFRSWVLQKCDFPFQVVMNVLNEKRIEEYEKLSEDKPDNCTVVINKIEMDGDFNMAVSNNIGLRKSKDSFYTVFSEADIVYKFDFLSSIIKFIESKGVELPFCVIGRYPLSIEFRCVIKDPLEYTQESGFEGLFIPAVTKVDPVPWGCWIGRTKLFYKLGGFDERLFTHFDADIDRRAVEFCRATKIHPMQDFRFFNIYYGLQMPVENQVYRDGLYNYHASTCLEIVEGKALDDYFVESDLDE